MAKNEPEITFKRLYTIELHEDDYFLLKHATIWVNGNIDIAMPGMSTEMCNRLKILADRLARSENIS